MFLIILIIPWIKPMNIHYFKNIYSSSTYNINFIFDKKYNQRIFPPDLNTPSLIVQHFLHFYWTLIVLVMLAQDHCFPCMTSFSAKKTREEKVRTATPISSISKPNSLYACQGNMLVILIREKYVFLWC